MTWSWITAILYSCLATSLRFLAIIVYIHLYLLLIAFTFLIVSIQLPHQQKSSPSGRNGCVIVHALHQSCQRHLGCRVLCTRCEYHASLSISCSDRCFTFSSRSVGLLFRTNTLVLWPPVTIHRNGFIGYTLPMELQCDE